MAADEAVVAMCAALDAARVATQSLYCVTLPRAHEGPLAWCVRPPGGAVLNRALMLLLVVPFAAASLSGAETPVARHWSAAQFTDIQRKIVASSATGSGIDILMEDPHVRAVLLHRQDNSQAELHQRLSEFYIVRSAGAPSWLVGRP